MQNPSPSHGKQTRLQKRWTATSFSGFSAGFQWEPPFAWTFTRRAFQPVVSSFTQALLALRFGNCELTAKELAVIDAQTDAIADAAPAWNRKDASAIATRLTEQIYTALTREFLET